MWHWDLRGGTRVQGPEVSLSQLKVLVLDCRVNPFEPGVSLDHTLYPMIEIILHPPFRCNVDARGSDYFRVEIETQRQLERIIAKLESDLEDGILCYGAYISFTESFNA